MWGLIKLTLLHQVIVTHIKNSLQKNDCTLVG